jgi:RNA polymerase subunit RPABC4/transcription elongation factor Spt4
MAMIKCLECNKNISDKALSCPHCGFEMSKENIEKHRIENPPVADMVNCPYCKAVISKFSKTCKNCKKEILEEDMNEEIRKINKSTIIGVGCLIIIVIFVIWIASSGSCSEGSSSSSYSSKTVENSSWDGSVSQVKDWLRENLKDPGSLEFIEWGTVVETSSGYSVRVKYRAKNSFGGYVIEEKIFTLDHSGNVLSEY